MRNSTRVSLTLARVRRSTVVVAVAAGAVATVAATTTASLLARAERAASSFGPLVPVPVVANPVAAGDALDEASVRYERRPAALVPRGAATGVVAGRVATVALAPGEVVIAGRLAATLVPPGWRALAVGPPGVGAHPDVLAGDVVDVLDVGAEGGATVAEGIVVARSNEAGVVTVAVPARDAPRVAYAATAGTAVLALTAPRPRR